MLLVLSGFLWARARGLRSSRYTIAALEESIEKHEVLRVERDLNKSLVERAPVILLHLDPQGFIQYVNPYFESLTGYRLEEIQGKEWIGTFVPERDRDRIRAVFHAAIHEAPTRGNINPILLRDGEEREIEWNDQPLPNEQGEGLGIVAVGVDVTERRRKERELLIKNAAIDSSMNGIALADLEGNLSFVNRSFLGMWGVESPEEVLGRPAIEFWETPEAAQDIVNALHERGSWAGEMRASTRSGLRFDVQVSAHMVTDREGEPLCMMASFTNISDQKLLERSLRESESKLREAQRLTQTGSWDLDLSENILQWSDEIYHIFEVDKERFGASYEAFLSLVHPEDRAAVDSAYIESTVSGESYHYTHRLLLPDGRIKYVEERGETEHSQDGRALRSRGTVQDLTDRVLAEKKIQTQLVEKEYLLKEVHHRVKNNLQVVSSLLYLQRQRADSPVFSNLLLESETRIAAMSIVHERLYNSGDFSGIDFRGYSMELVDSLMLAYGADPDQIEVVISAESLLLPLDFAINCGLIMNEILSNSLKHAFPGGQRGTLTIQMRMDNGTDYVLEISDDGPGFSAGPGQHAPDSLGLRLIERLVMQNHGAIRREAPPGTRYLLRFPGPGPAPRSGLVPAQKEQETGGE